MQFEWIARTGGGRCVLFGWGACGVTIYFRGRLYGGPLRQLRCQLPFQGSPWLVRCCKCIRAAGLWLMLEATDYGGSQVTTAVRKRKRSGKRFACRVTGYGCRHKSVWQPGQCAASMTDAAQASSWQGSCERGGLGAPFAFNQKSICKANASAGRLRPAAPRLWRRLSSPILSSLLKKESGPRRAVTKLSGRN